MGWVTLTLRKTELKRTHADYQSRLLQISREKRQMAREYHYQQTQERNKYNAMIRFARDTWNADRDSLNEAIEAAGSDGTAQGTDADGNSVFLTATEAQNELDKSKDKYEERYNQLMQDMESELEMIEQESTDAETMLDQEQVQIEAQLEAISAEIEAVGEAISSQIQASTIKLS